MRCFNYSSTFFRVSSVIAAVMFSLGGCLMAQDGNNTLEFRMDAFRNGQVKLVEYYGHDRITVDSVMVDEEGRGVFLMNDSYNPGMYRIQTNKGRGGIDVI